MRLRGRDLANSPGHPPAECLPPVLSGGLSQLPEVGAVRGIQLRTEGAETTVGTHCL